MLASTADVCPMLFGFSALKTLQERPFLRHKGNLVINLAILRENKISKPPSFQKKILKSQDSLKSVDHRFYVIKISKPN